MKIFSHHKFFHNASFAFSLSLSTNSLTSFLFSQFSCVCVGEEEEGGCCEERKITRKQDEENVEKFAFREKIKKEAR